MKTFAERSPVVIAAVGVGLTAAICFIALNFDKLPFINGTVDHSAYFAEAGGLLPNAAVQVAGLQVGNVSDVDLDGDKVVVNFKINDDIRLGDRTEAAVKTKTVLGAKVLEITPRGDGEMSGPIPLDRTKSAYQLPDALGDLSSTVSGLDTTQLSDSLTTLADTFKGTPPELKEAVRGVARFADVIDSRDAELRNLLKNAYKVTGVLSQRSDQVVQLISNTNALLGTLRSQSNSLDELAGNISNVSRQLSGLIAENRTTLKPALEKLNGVLTIVDDRKEKVQESIKLLNSYGLALGETVASGPFFKAYLGNLLPGQLTQPFIDAAFSDLGLDPATLLPSDRSDPQVGQPGTPPLPVPYPRTGQGGDPRMTLPDAITGKPGDPRYPLKPEPPQPPPGGPPPGPPAGFDPAAPSLTVPQPVFEPAPGEVAPSAAPTPLAPRPPQDGQ